MSRGIIPSTFASRRQRAAAAATSPRICRARGRPMRKYGVTDISASMARNRLTLEADFQHIAKYTDLVLAEV